MHIFIYMISLFKLYTEVKQITNKLKVKRTSTVALSYTLLDYPYDRYENRDYRVHFHIAPSGNFECFFDDIGLKLFTNWLKEKNISYKQPYNNPKYVSINPIYFEIVMK